VEAHWQWKVWRIASSQEAVLSSVWSSGESPVLLNLPLKHANKHGRVTQS